MKDYKLIWRFVNNIIIILIVKTKWTEICSVESTRKMKSTASYKSTHALSLYANQSKPTSRNLLLRLVLLGLRSVNSYTGWLTILTSPPFPSATWKRTIILFLNGKLEASSMDSLLLLWPSPPSPSSADRPSFVDLLCPCSLWPTSWTTDTSGDTRCGGPNKKKSS